jgi:squalene-hopene/tetraprenyl-beta-curcumene cyclase
MEQWMSLTAGEPKMSRAEATRRELQRQRAPLGGSHQRPSAPAPHAFRAPRQLAQAIEAAQAWLLAAQRPDGHWCGELEGDTILETEYVLLLHFLGRLGDPRTAKAACYVRRKQLAEGGWAIYPGGPPEVSASVKAYFVLKLAGDDPEAPHMQRARRAIHELGGVEACNSFTKIYLAICGQYDWWRCPAVPPEMVLLPRWFYFNLFEISSWSRGIVVPLSIVWALRPVRPVAAEHGIGELRTAPAGPRRLPGPAGPAGLHAGPAGLHAGPAGLHAGPAGLQISARLRQLPLYEGASPFWRGFFLLLDRALKTGERLRLTPLRQRALARAEAWILERLADSDGLGAIFPPIVNTIFALCCLGYDQDHPLVRGQVRELERLEIEEPEDPDDDTPAATATAPAAAPATAAPAIPEPPAAPEPPGPPERPETTALRLQPCFSAVWDTALAMHGLSDSGLDPEHPALQAARRWLVEREIRRTGDWSVKAPGAPPGGWCFEYRNAFYPDCDDTAEVLTALSALTGPSGGRDEPVVERGTAWLLGMQNDDGGWGAFDRGCDKEILTYVPFADHNALLDPSTADVTGRAVDALRRLGMAPDAPRLARAAAFLRRQQEADGSWYGRWGCNYVYGTWLALQALARCGPIAGEPWCRRAVDWLLSRQNPDGGWGESPRSYDDPAQKGIGPSTAAQTAWALMGLFAATTATVPGSAGVPGSPGAPGSPATPGGPAAPAALAIERGVDYLLRTQRADGSWRDEPWTATGFPRVFYLRYHLYAVYFPLMALAEYKQTQRQRAAAGAAVTPPQHPYPLAVPVRTTAVEGAV